MMRNGVMAHNGIIDWRQMVEECIANIGIPLDFFLAVLPFQWFFAFLVFWGFGSLQTSLLCIVGDLAGGGSVAVAVGISYTWHMTFVQTKFSSFLSVLVSVLLSAHVERFSVSRVQHFLLLKNQCSWTLGRSANNKASLSSFLTTMWCQSYSLLCGPTLAPASCLHSRFWQ